MSLFHIWGQTRVLQSCRAWFFVSEPDKTRKVHREKKEKRIFQRSERKRFWRVARTAQRVGSDNLSDSRFCLFSLTHESRLEITEADKKSKCKQHKRRAIKRVIKGKLWGWKIVFIANGDDDSFIGLEWNWGICLLERWLFLVFLVFFAATRVACESDAVIKFTNRARQTRSENNLMIESNRQLQPSDSLDKFTCWHKTPVTNVSSAKFDETHLTKKAKAAERN